MLATYDQIVEHSNSQIYNPSTSNIPNSLLHAFLYADGPQGTSII